MKRLLDAENVFDDINNKFYKKYIYSAGVSNCPPEMYTNRRGKRVYFGAVFLIVHEVYLKEPKRTTAAPC